MAKTVCICPSCNTTYDSSIETCPKDGVPVVRVTEERAKDNLIGKVLGNRYHLLSRLGKGGMGVVYKAQHRVIGRTVAVKVLNEEFSDKPTTVERFLREARAASTIQHPNIVEVTDFGRTEDGRFYFVMEYLPGMHLAALIRKEGPLSEERAARLGHQIARALAEAHTKGIIHRDLKPHNIVVVNQDQGGEMAKVLDFGVAKIDDPNSAEALTKAGALIGTPAYMSPEQVRGEAVDARTDIYALGVMLYQMITGDVPFKADTMAGVLTKQLYEAPIPPSRRLPGVGLSRAMEGIILRALEKDPVRRTPSMDVVADDLRAIMEGEVRLPSRRRRGPGLLVALTLIVGLMALGGILILQFWESPVEEPPLAPAAAAVVLPEAPPPPARHVTLNIRSTPPQAQVYEAGRLLGQTPLTLARPASSEMVLFLLKEEGYEDQSVEISLAESRTLDLALERVRRPSKGRKAKRAAGKAPPQAKPPEDTPQAPSPRKDDEMKIRELKEIF